MSKRQASVRHEGCSTDMEPLEFSLLQGSPASPLLFRLYTESLHRVDNPWQRFGYADDCAMLSIGNTPEEAAEAAQAKVDATQAWGSDNKVSFSPAKTEAQLFNKTRHPLPLSIAHDDREITQKPAMRWLGAWLEPKLTWKRHIEEWCAAARQVSACLRGLSKVYSGAPPLAARKAIRTIVEPKLFFGAEV